MLKKMLFFVIIFFGGGYSFAMDTTNGLLNEKLHKVVLSNWFNGIESIKPLLDLGADINSKDDEGCTILHDVSSLGFDSEIVTYLVNNGAKVNMKNNKGKAPLHLALTYCIADVLCQNGADVNSLDNKGRTPLHVAAADHDDFVVMGLLRNGADHEIKNKLGKIPFDHVRDKIPGDLEYIKEAKEGIAGMTKDRTSVRKTVFLHVAKKLKKSDDKKNIFPYFRNRQLNGHTRPFKLHPSGLKNFNCLNSIIKETVLNNKVPCSKPAGQLTFRKYS